MANRRQCIFIERIGQEIFPHYARMMETFGSMNRGDRNLGFAQKYLSDHHNVQFLHKPEQFTTSFWIQLNKLSKGVRSRRTVFSKKDAKKFCSGFREERLDSVQFSVFNDLEKICELPLLTD